MWRVGVPLGLWILPKPLIALPLPPASEFFSLGVFPGFQWSRQQQGASFAGAIESTPFGPVTGLAQGDPFNPLTLSAFLCAPFRQLCRRLPNDRHFLYVDDRTSMVRNLEAVADVQGVWDEVCLATGMQNHALKVQIWYRSARKVPDEASTQGVVLGLCSVLGPSKTRSQIVNAFKVKKFCVA